MQKKHIVSGSLLYGLLSLEKAWPSKQRRSNRCRTGFITHRHEILINLPSRPQTMDSRYRTKKEGALFVSWNSQNLKLQAQLAFSLLLWTIFPKEVFWIRTLQIAKIEHSLWRVENKPDCRLVSVWCGSLWVLAFLVGEEY